MHIKNGIIVVGLRERISMRRVVWLLLCILMFSACKKDKSSDSTYQSADISFAIGENVMHDSIGTNSVVYFMAAVVDGLPGGLAVSLNENNMDYESNPDVPGYGNYDSRGNDPDSLKQFKYNTLKIVSANGVEDFSYSWNAIPFYDIPIPYSIPYSQRLTINIPELPGADSISITLSNWHGMDTTVSIHCGIVNFSPERLYVLAPQYVGEEGRISISAFRHYIVLSNGRLFKLTNSSTITYNVKFTL